MTSKDFVYWHQGMFELADPQDGLSAKQIEIIKNHLKLVFLYEIDPSYTDNKFVQMIFQNIHDGKNPLDGLDVKEQEEIGSLVYSPNNHPFNDELIRC